jgi:murein DD-endopeptidase MepM/ murein hydrolase activator NlpD
VRALCNAAIAASVVLLATCSSPSGPSVVGGRWMWRENCPVAYPPQESSPYVLPYQVGQSFVVAGNCSTSDHTRFTWNQYAYDFIMPMRTPVVAARDGRVIRLDVHFADNTGIDYEENYLQLRHADGTTTWYIHLTKDGALVAVGDLVAQGQIIALSGNSGESARPHLHFQVDSACDCTSIPATFRNTRPHPHGLVGGESYRAE